MNTNAFTGVRGKAGVSRALFCACAGLLIGMPALADNATGTNGDPPLPAGAMNTGAAPARPMMQRPVHGPSCRGAVVGESTVTLSIGKSVLLPLREPARNRTVGNPAVVETMLVSPQTLYLLGQAVGSTNMIVQGASGACRIIDVVVNADSGGIQTSLAQLMPEERNIRVTTAGDHVVLSGSVSGAEAAQRAVEIARIYANTNGGKAGGVLNLMSIDSPQQVMLEVKVAEVDKTLLDQLGAKVNLGGGFGSWTGGLVSSLLTGASNTLSFSKSNKLPLSLTVDAQKADSLVKILAEPNLATLSGQEATFLAGGEVFIPVPQGGSNGGITLQQENYGVSLKFTPTVLSNGRINLQVAPEVSQLSSTGVSISQ